MTFRLYERTGELWFPHPGLYKGVIHWGKWLHTPPLPLSHIRARVGVYGATRRVSLLAGVLQPGEAVTVVKSDPAKRNRHGEWDSNPVWVVLKRAE